MKNRFRVWDKKNGVMCSVFGIYPPLDTVTVEVPGKPRYELHKGEYELMESTRMHDCKRNNNSPDGQEVFEGDIVKINGKYFRDDIPHNFVITYDESRGWFGIQMALHTQTLNEFDFEDDVEVIGNIYENPELLGKLRGND